ncbi:MAG: hypothetical protein AB7F64_04170, partial [Gammaproteobacteria bacterium]
IMTDCLSTAHQDSKSFLEAYFALESYIQTRPRETARESTHVISNFHFFSAISWRKPYAKIFETRFNKERKLTSAVALRKFVLGISTLPLNNFNSQKLYQDPLSEGRLHGIYEQVKPFMVAQPEQSASLNHTEHQLHIRDPRYHTL